MNSGPSTSQTIMFADIAGSTRLYDQLGDDVATKLVSDACEIMRAVVSSNKGVVVKTIGDGVMCHFKHADHASRAAIRLHMRFSTDTRLVLQNVSLRIGFHHGSFIEADQDLYGDAVNIAARMAAQAKPGQIIVSGLTVERLSDENRAISRMVDQTRVKGKSDPIDLYEIAWGQPSELTVMGTVTSELVSGTPGKYTLLTLDLENQHVNVDYEHPIVHMGRSRGNQLVVNSPRVSRLHARVEMHKDKFVLIDQSTNGTYVYPEGQQMQLLRRDELTLEGEGFFSLGRSTVPDSPLTIHYLCI